MTGIDTWTLLNTRNFRRGIEVLSTLVSNRSSIKSVRLATFISSAGSSIGSNKDLGH